MNDYCDGTDSKKHHKRVNNALFTIKKAKNYDNSVKSSHN